MTESQTESRTLADASKRRGVSGELAACVAAVTFLTRLPLGRLVAHDPGDLPRSISYFPLVGALVGAAGGAAFAIGTALWPPYLAALLSVAFTVWLTGAFHEDALADSFDGFGGGRDRARVLQIMRDSRVGSYALVGMILVIVTKIAALVAVFHAASAAADAAGAGHATGALAVAAALVAAHALGRWSSVALMAWLPYVREPALGERSGTGSAFVGAATSGRLIAASIIAVLAGGLALGWAMLAAAVAAGGVTWLAGRYFARRIGGITGDALGAANQLVELAVYLLLAALR